ncbi:MAG: NYN domain-containing protein [Candidatus Odinarchaeum yellowstonii]|uniref:NYN domain-containing protein n=1 Tax=Odinarchaeota yellowstonii (strain LCB_4) TaxID=1841599 RepID=A0AAF0IBN3_ODILC|nr:MAG: NYN domain-containing protein [Candidatus Odinarchaeum yellowstonii]
MSEDQGSPADSKEAVSKSERVEKWSLAKKILPFFKKKIAVLVDGPNILRKEFNVKLEEILEAVTSLGKVQVARVYLNQHASEKLIEATSNSGFEPIISTIDVHLKMAIDSVELVNKLELDYIAIASRHARCVPILHKLKERNLGTVVIGFEPGFSVALQNTADYVFKLAT